MIDITDQDVFTALRTFLLSFLPVGTEVVQGIDNQVPMPISGFVVMTSSSQTRLATNETTYPATINPTTKSIFTPVQYVIQLDFYGADSASWATQTQALFRDPYATDSMPSNIQPLHADDPVQLPMINAEQQYEQRWKLSVNMQYNPIITVSQDYMNVVTVGIKEVDTTFNP